MKNILDFINSSTDSWHTAAEVAAILEENGFVMLDEADEWQIVSGGRYYVMRNMSSVIAFRVPDTAYKSFMIAAAHGESPSFKIKEIPDLSDKKYTRLNIEPYGGAVKSTWLDRPLSVSGRVVAENGNGLKTHLVRLGRDSLVIPSLAPHLEREKGEINMLRDMPPLYALGEADFMDEIASAAGVEKESIKDFDLMLYNREEARIWGRNNEFISAPRLDDLACVYALLCGFVGSQNPETVQVCCVFDNEEVGSGTRQGAKSDFLSSTLRRISESCGKSFEEHMRELNSSFLVSADNGHAIHPNRPEMSDSKNYPELGGGVVIKYNAAQRYTTDAVSGALLKRICENAGVSYQYYANRSDLPGGSTLGNIATEKTSVASVDVGLAQLAMHSAYETAASEDIVQLSRMAEELYRSRIESRNGEFVISK